MPRPECPAACGAAWCRSGRAAQRPCRTRSARRGRGASAKGGNFYLRTKGEMEEGLRAFGFGRLDILRPGLLMGAREGPARLGEGIAMMAAPLTDALLHGSLRRYRSIPADIVARAMLALAARREPGTYVHENDSIRALAD